MRDGAAEKECSASRGAEAQRHPAGDAADGQREEMLTAPVPRLIRALAMPTVVSMLITSAYNIADTFFVAKLGTEASGAVGIVFALMALIQAAGFAIGMGAGSTISRLLGEQQEAEAQELASTGVFLSLVFGGVLMGAGLLFLEPLMRLLGATEGILPYAVTYGRYILFGAPAMTAAFVLSNLLRSEGRAKWSMLGIGAGGVLNLALAPLMIFLWKWGIAGAAIATAISQTVSFFILLSCYVFHKSALRLSVRHIARRWEPYGVILQQGFPSFLRQGLASVATVVLNRQSAAFSDSAVAAMSIVGKIFMVSFSLMIGFGQGFQPVIGFNYGAKEWKRVRQSFSFTLCWSVILAGAVGAAGFCFAEELMGLFLGADGQVVAIGAFTLRAQCVTLPLVPVGIVGNMVFQSTGKAGISTFLSALRQGIVFLPLIWLLPMWWGLMGVQLTQAVSDGVTALVCLPFLIGFLHRLRREEQGCS